MPEAVKARVFMSGRSQHVTIPAEFRFATDAARADWVSIFAAVDEAGFQEFLQDRDQGEYEAREEL